MRKMFRNWSFWIHICQVALTIGIIYGTTITTLDAHGKQIATIRADAQEKERERSQSMDKIRDDITSVRIDVAAIRQSVHDIKSALNIKHRDDR